MAGELFCKNAFALRSTGTLYSQIISRFLVFETTLRWECLSCWLWMLVWCWGIFLFLKCHQSFLTSWLKSIQKQLAKKWRLLVLAKGIINHTEGSNATVLGWLLNYLVSCYEDVWGSIFPKLISCRHSFHCLISLHHFPFHYQMVELSWKHKLPEDR